MNSVNVIPLRHIVAPAVKELYEEDQEGYDAVADEPVMNALSNENDRVDGLEAIYGHILNHRPRVMTYEVTGTEGLVSWIADSVKSFIQTVKKFFKWLWSFFSGKEAAVDVAKKQVKEKIAGYGAIDGPIKYPKDVLYLYPKQGKLDVNLSWLTTVMQTAEKNIAKADKYIDELQTLFKAIYAHTNKDGKAEDLKGVVDSFKKGFEDLFSKDGTGTTNFSGSATLLNKGGTLSFVTGSDQPKFQEGATFFITTSQLKTLFDEYNSMDKKIREFSGKTYDLEKGTLVVLNRFIQVSGQESPQLKAPLETIKAEVRRCMTNVKALHLEFMKLNKRTVDLLGLCTKKVK
jgi:hypothetical protein